MARPKGKANRAAFEYIEKYACMHSKRHIAQMLFEERPDLFGSAEKARKDVRYLTGAAGRGSRQHAENNKLFSGQRPESIKKIPSVLLLDIETAPMLGYFWTLFKPHLTYHNIEEDWFIISWAVKWLHRPDVYSDVVTPREAVNCNDKRIMQSLHKVLEQADVVIAHNAKKFDLRKIYARFLEHKIPRPSPFQIIDTLLESRKTFAHSSHRLDYLGRKMFNDQKLETSFGLWKRCKKGDAESLEHMDKYCRQDVLLLEEVYMEIRGWIKSHPNMRLYAEMTGDACPVCLGANLKECGDYVTPAGRFTSMQCQECHAVSRQRKGNITLKERETLIISTAR